MSCLILTGIQKRFAGGTVAVRDFNLAMEQGEFVTFLGPSGCDKTTTLRTIAGFEQPTAGAVVLDGTDITERPPNRRNVRKSCSFPPAAYLVLDEAGDDMVTAAAVAI